MRLAAALCLLLAVAAGQDDFARVKTLITQLGSIDEQMRVEAAAELGRLGPRAKGAAPALCKALGDESSWVANTALASLKLIGPEAVPALVKALGNANQRVRELAMRLLDESFARDLEPHLRAVAALLRDKSAVAREHGAAALGKHGEAATDLLIAALGARESGAQDAAVLGLSKVGGPAVPPLIRALANVSAQTRQGAARALGALKAQGAGEELFAALSDKVPDVAAAAARALAAIRCLAERVLPRLLEGLRDPNATFREACIDSLAAWGQPAVKGLVAALGVEDTRAAASLAFLRMDEKGAEALREPIAQGPVPIRCAALATLSRFPSEFVSTDAIKDIGLCLRDDSLVVRASAARALAGLGPRARDDWLKNGTSHDDPAVRAASFYALGELGMDPGKAEDADPAVRVEVLLASWKIRGGAGAEEIRKIAFDETATAGVRAAALTALGDMGLGAHGVDVTPLLEKQPVEIRRAAAGALARMVLPSAQAIRDSRAAARPDKAVEAGLAWLAGAQEEDGQWDAGYYTAGTTGLALLSFLGANCRPGDGPHGAAVRNGLSYLIRNQTERGVLSDRRSHEYLVSNAIAAMALTEGYLLTGEFRYRRAAQWALDHIAWARNPGLAWRYDPRGGENDTHVTTWMLFATRLGDVAGMRVDPGSYAGGAKWIETMTEPNFGGIGYNYPGGACARPEGMQDTFPPDRSHAMTAAGLWCRRLLGSAMVEDSVYEKGVDLLLEVEPRWSPGFQDMIYWHFGALVLNGDAKSKKWEKSLLDALERGRKPTGAWKTEDVWAEDLVKGDNAKGASVYVTAMGVLTLLTPSRYPRDFVAKPKLSTATRAAIAALKKACADEDPQVREIATAACARLGG
ncbi:MAG: HEAT repeat domain-containing protein [Planctomycetota bacterium]